MSPRRTGNLPWRSGPWASAEGAATMGVRNRRWTGNGLSLPVMARLVRIGVKTGPLVASSSWPGWSEPSVAACADRDGPDKPGHDRVATIVPPARYLTLMPACPDQLFKHVCRDRWPGLSGP